MAGKRQARYSNDKPQYLSQPNVIAIPPTVEHAVKPELMHFDLHGQRARDLEIIRLLNEISSKLDGK